MNPRLWKVFLVFGALAAGGYWFLPDTWQSNAYYDTLGMTSAGAVLLGARRHRPTKPVMWYLLAAGMAAWSFGDMAFGFNRFVLQREMFPSFADGLYLLGYPLLAAALFVLIRGRTSRRDRDGLLDGAILATALALPTWSFIMYPTWQSGGDTSGFGLAVLLAYPAGDLLLVAMVARLVLTPGARTTSYWLLIAGLVLTLGGDIAYAYLTANGLYDGGLVDVCYLLSYVLWGACALHPSMRSLSETAPDQAVRLTLHRLGGLTTLAALMAPGILIVQHVIQPTTVDWVGASVAAVVMLTLVLARIAGLVTQVQNQAAQLDALAHNDALTGVPNRRAWDLELARHLANARRDSEPVAVALLDLDHFKRFNDQYGHQAGDRLLKEAAAAWRSQLRGQDLLARYGGEEFGVCVPGLTAAALAATLERLQASTPLGQSFSGGVAQWTGDESPERLVARADEALYEAKRAGRSRVVAAPAERAPSSRQEQVEVAELVPEVAALDRGAVAAVEQVPAGDGGQQIQV